MNFATHNFYCMGAQIHIGNLVRDFLIKKKMKQNALINYLPKNKSNISKLLKREDWHVSELVAASECVKVDLFQYISHPNIEDSDVVREDSPLYQITMTKQQLDECIAKYNDEKARRIQNDELIKLLKEKIRSLEIELAGLRSQRQTA